jgi:RNA polymerase sigma factor (sigma-70 family)
MEALNPMFRNNDYVKLTRDYLRNIGYYRIAVANMSTDIKDLESRMRDVPIKITDYGPMPGGGSGELNGVERAAESKLEAVEDYKRKSAELKQLSRQIDRLENCIENLPEEEQQAVRLFYIDRLNYGELACAMGWSERTVKRRVSSGTRAVAVMLFGPKAEKNVQFVVC